MFSSLDIFRYVLAYAISCLETISSQYVRIVDICLVLGYQVFLALNVVSRCSDVVLATKGIVRIACNRNPRLQSALLRFLVYL